MFLCLVFECGWWVLPAYVAIRGQAWILGFFFYPTLLYLTIYISREFSCLHLPPPCRTAGIQMWAPASGILWAVLLWMRKSSHRLTCLNVCSPIGGTIWGICRTFRRWSFARGSTSLGSGFGDCCRLPALCLWLKMQSLSSQLVIWTLPRKPKAQINPTFHMWPFVIVFYHSRWQVTNPCVFRG